MEEDSSDSEELLLPIDNSEHFRQISIMSLDYTDPNSFSGIIRAVINDDLTQIMRLINSGRSPNVVDNHGNTPLHIAVFLEKMPIVEYLLSLETLNVNAQNFYGETALLVGVKVNSVTMVEALLAAKASVNLANNDSVTPLHLAVTLNSTMTLLLLKNGAEFDVTDYGGDTPLNEAVKHGTFETVAMLLYHGADATIPCDNNLSPFMFAIIRENYDMQEQLIEYEIDFNRATAEGMSILFLAITHHSPFGIEIVRRGADIHHYYNHLNVLSLIIDAGNVELFKEVWSKIDYQEVWSEEYPSVLKYALNEMQYEIFDYIMNSDKIPEVMDHLFSERIVYFILRKIHDNYPVENATRAIFILLTHGLEIDEFEMEYVFSILGYGSLYKVLLYMDVKLTPIGGNCLLSSVLLHVSSTVDYLVDAYLLREPIYQIQLINLRQILPFCTNAKLFQYFIEKSHEGYHEIDSEIVGRLSSKVPSLLELSRNQLRVSVCLKHGIKKSSDFYTVIQYMDIPQIIKDIINFKFPIY